ncbi:hypothetical protein BT93_E0701 [Corymbia citriodora subsp. variegata]|nr:hypothetical protein BT93_E0701 [Corymbia citriodora subsp. variegata]
MAAPGSGFGREMGPSGPGPGKSATTPFGGFSRPSPPRPSPPPPSNSPPPPPLFGAAPVRSPSPRRPEISRGTQLLPLSFDNGYQAPARPYASSSAFRPSESFPRLGRGQSLLYKHPDAQISQRPSSVASLVAARNQGSVTAGIARFQDPGRSNLLVTSPERDNSRNFSRKTLTRTILPQVSHSPQSIRNNYSPVAQATQLALPSIRSSYSPQEIPRFEEAQRPATASTAWGSQPKSPSNYANSVPHNDLNGLDNSRRGIPTGIIKVEKTKRTRSPPLSPMNDLQESSPLSDDNYNRSSMSLPVSSTKTGMIFSHPDSGVRQNVLSSSDISLEAPSNKQSFFPVPKRTRSPAPSDKDIQQNPSSSPEEIEREMQAKAKRLARFKVELSEPVQRSSIIAEPKVSTVHRDLSIVQERNEETFNDGTGDFPSGSFDNGDVESSSNIVGLCPDMCPESERAERERKGDLDQYERLDGDRNQTSKSLAVKKYNRTAEREADLIRPMPVLLKTIDYLLSLLDQPYNDRLLGLYNFLWDRMRAVRMDLRMQHIFDLEAVKMLEQMIRLHVIAMHELCEFTKGEGFSEGFDAHLNIEQMNKTSAELFQLYDDHRKKGISIPTEKEFRGYYALLKLDKHPGYKVEPAELSLDLAKMTPEIRQTPEVLFARDVARACRTGNYIAFFRLARKASYLQACLMHAHFAKLRSQALASLHSGLQSNQGLPVAVVARWLAMEEEDIESLLQYHGFSVREYEEPYMVKEGPFLHGDRDFPTKCSELVHLKKSIRIIKDVLIPDSISSLSKGATKFQLTSDRKREMKNIQPFEKDSSIYVSDQEMAISETTPSHSIYAPDQDMAISETISSPKKVCHVNIPFRPPEVARHVEVDNKISGVGFVPWNLPVVNSSPKAALINLFAKADHDFGNTHEIGGLSGNELMCLPLSPSSVQHRVLPVELESNRALQSSVVQEDAMGIANEEAPHVHQENGIEVYVNEDIYINDEDEEVAEAKLKLILRIWKRRSARRRELREQRQLVAADALNSLSLGPPVQWKNDQPSNFNMFDIDQVTSERRGKHRQSWSRLNVADVAAGELIKRNPNAKCLCWKIIVCSQMESLDGKIPERSFNHQSAIRWLLAKIMAAGTEHPDLVFSTPGLSIWRKWVPCQSNMDLTCHLSVIGHMSSNNSSTTIDGASAALFLLAESIPLEPQKIRLHQLITSFPSGSRLPLLILIDSRAKLGPEDATREIIYKLGLHDIDQSRVGSLSVIFLVEDKKMEYLDEFFSDQRLREGLHWLARTSPLHSPVHCIETRELVLNHLNSFLERLEKSGYEVGPNQCIMALNEALDQALGEVATAADTNPSGWPCPEVSLLDEHCEEHRIADFYLPSVGWSTSARIEPILSALRKCKLPNFIDDISWLRRGCRVGMEVESQRLELEACLIRYLTQSSSVMGDALARNEVSLMLQKHARLELQDSAYYMVPNWVMIFRRIFNWRLMILWREELSVCYVLEHVAPRTSSSKNMLQEDSHPYLEFPSLDEMLEVGWADLSHLPSSSQPQISEPMTGSPILGRDQTWDTAYVDDLSAAGRANILQDNEPAFVDDGACTISTLRSNIDTPVNFAKADDGSEKLNRLLQQCDLLQNVLDEKLSVYF